MKVRKMKKILITVIDIITLLIIGSSVLNIAKILYRYYRFDRNKKISKNVI